MCENHKNYIDVKFELRHPITLKKHYPSLQIEQRKTLRMERINAHLDDVLF